MTDGYDFEDRLTDRTGPTGSVQIVYDGDGNKVREVTTENGLTTAISYLVDTLNPTGYAQVLEELQNGTVVRTYTYGHDLLLQDQRDGGGTWNASWYVYDGHGNVRGLTNASGSLTDTYDYDAFGTLLSAQGTTFNRYRYCGEQFDSALGLYYLRARLMNPLTGRFWNSDRYEGDNLRPESLHKYLYAEMEPVLGSDPSGYERLNDLQAGAAIRAEVTRNVIRTSSTTVKRRLTKTLLCQFGVATFKIGMDGFQGHHPIPKNVGGPLVQRLIYLPPETHRAFHQVLNLLLRSEPEFAGQGGRSSKAVWQDLLTGKPKRKALVLFNVRVAARFIDRKCGLKAPNSLTEAVKESSMHW